MDNIFKAIPIDLSEEKIEQLVGNNHMKVERIISKGHKSPASGWYDQNFQEWVLLLKGEARLSFIDESPITLKPGDYLNIPAHKKHRVDWTTPDDETIWLVIHY